MGKILVIEDDRDNMETIKFILETDGHEVTPLMGTQNILEDVQKYLPDLVLTDYLLKGQNGAEICKNIRSNKTTNHIPVVLTTAHRDIAILIDRTCFNGIVIKPFEMSTLLDAVKKGLTNP